MTTAAQEFDVVVAGGGMVGAGAALALALLDLKIAVVDRVAPPARQAPGYDDRSTALAVGSRRILESLGVWPALAPHAAPIRRVHVSEYRRFGTTVLAADDLALEALGWVVENPPLAAALDDALERAPTVTRFQPATITAVRAGDMVVDVEFDAEGVMQRCRAPLLVGADGAQSTVRTLLGIDATIRDYGQTAVVANLTPRDPHQGTAWERFTPEGPVALLPLDERRCALIWTMPRDRADARLALDDDAFCG